MFCCIERLISITSDRNHFRPVEQKRLTVCVAVPSCVCRSGPSSLTGDHRTDTQQTLGEPASPTNHCGPHRDVRQPKTRGDSNGSHMRYDRTNVSETVSRLTLKPPHRSYVKLYTESVKSDVSASGWCFLTFLLPAGDTHSSSSSTSSRSSSLCTSSHVFPSSWRQRQTVKTETSWCSTQQTSTALKLFLCSQVTSHRISN